MFLRTTTEPQKSESEATDSSTATSSPVSIVFPYVGPPGCGPGLLGSRPGALKMDYLIALEHHATSLKSALTIAASLRNSVVLKVCNSMCDVDYRMMDENGLPSSTF